MRRIALAVAVTAALLAASFVGTAPSAKAQDLTGALGGDLRVALQSFNGTDPRTASPADHKVLELFYDSLARTDPLTLGLKPWAATGWAWDNDKNITVTLRTDLRFSDGTPYDANDVARALRQHVRNGVTEWKIIVLDPHTLRFDFHRTTVPSLTVTIQDDDSVGVRVTPTSLALREGQTGTYTVALWTAPTANVTVHLKNDTQARVTPLNLTFGTGNWSAPQTVTVTAIHDGIPQGTHVATIAQNASSADLRYNATTVPGVTVTIQDIDKAGVTVAPPEVSVAEGGATASYAMSLWKAPTADVTFSLTASAGATVSPTSLRFTPTNWNTPQSVTVTAVDDNVIQWWHSASIAATAASADTAYNAATVPTVTVHIQDNDEAGVSINPSALALVEGGGSATYTVGLWRVPTADVTITLTAGTNVTIAPNALTFTPANWNTPQSVTVTAVDDTVAQGLHAAIVTGRTASADPDYDAISPNRLGPGLFYTQALTAFLAWDRNGDLKDSGPFSVRSFVPGQLVLAANPYHFSGRPNLDTVTYKWPYTFDYGPNNTTRADDAACALMFREVHLIGWPLLANDISNTRDCKLRFGGFPDGGNRSLGGLNSTTSVPFVKVAKNPGNEFMYFGFTLSDASFFAGPPDGPGQKLRSAIQLLVNKGLYRNVEPNTAVTHSVINALNTPWAPVTCPPWTPCPFVVDASTIVVPGATRQKTDTDPSALALDAAGLVDRNGDGIREMPNGTPIAFRLLAPSFSLDPRKNTIANDFALQLKNVDLGVTLQVFDTAAALQQSITTCAACMYIGRYAQATQLPDWLSAMPELAQANDTELAQYLSLGANASFTQETRSLNVGRAAHVIGKNADVLAVLMYYDLEAFDFDSFTGWVDILGGINNVWSFQDLRLPALGSLTAKVSIFPKLGVAPGETTTVQVEVRDSLGVTIANATVALVAAAGSLNRTSGVTDGNGIFSAKYQPPPGVQAAFDVTVTANATKARYVGATASATLTVRPAPPGELLVAVSRGPDPEVASGSPVNVTVQVLDAATLDPVGGANVTLSTDLPGATFTPASGSTGADGLFTATFSAAVKQGIQYRIVATASRTGYVANSDGASLYVKSDLGNVVPTNRTKNVPGFEAAYAAGAIAIGFALVALARRRRDD